MGVLFILLKLLKVTLKEKVNVEQLSFLIDIQCFNLSLLPVKEKIQYSSPFPRT
jgi:hypothetical protein